MRRKASHVTLESQAGYYQELRRLVGRQRLIVTGANVLELDAHDRVLLMRRGDSGAWDVFGGALEPGETFEATARRELREEAGLDASELVFVDVQSGPECFHEYPNGDQIYGVGALDATYTARGAAVPDGAEALELAYFALSALPPNLDSTAGVTLHRYGEVVPGLRPLPP